MVGRISCILFVVASGLVHVVAPLIAVVILLCLLVVAFGMVAWLGLAKGKANIKIIWLLPVIATLSGLTTTYYRIETRLADHLAAHNIDKVSRVHAQVISLPKQDAGGLYFDARIIASIPEGIPKRIRITWPQPFWRGPYAKQSESKLPPVKPGEVWRMALTIRPVHGLQNPGGFDYEGYAFAAGIRAMGTVRGEPWLVEDTPYVSLLVMAQRARYYVREQLSGYLQNKRYGAVILALALGDQASVNASDWQVFNRTGITHLVSISGTHVTIISGLFGFAAFFLWRRIPYKGHMLAEKLPAQIVAAIFALVMAWLYCLLAGWGVPAQRTFYMLAVVVVTYVLKLTLCSSQILSLVALLVVAIDPWAVLSTGFWLSFTAVAVLILVAKSAVFNSYNPSASFGIGVVVRSIAYSAKLQLVITAALFPLLALLFNEISIVSPLVNAYAIPLVSFLITPLALLSALLATIPAVEAYATWFVNTTHALIEIMMVPTVFMANNKLASFAVASTPLWLTTMAIVGLIVAMLPYGLPGRNLAWLLILPALLWVPARPKHGYWNAYVLDVGQASAIVLQTAKHTFLFDTGVRSSLTSDSTGRVIMPFFKHLGINKLDILLVSHADIDHAGGLYTLLNYVPVEQSYASFNIDAWMQREAAQLEETPKYRLPTAMSLCNYGTSWHTDGVSFKILWPLEGQVSRLNASSKERNNNSCVLSVRGQKHSILLTGDINAIQERNLVQMGLMPHDVVMAAHHGSKSSSDTAFINAVSPKHVVFQAGSFNRYGHPSAVVTERWNNSASRLWRTDQQGAITIKSRKNNLNVNGHKIMKYRYWHG